MKKIISLVLLVTLFTSSLFISGNTVYADESELEFTQVALGFSHSLAITSEGRFFSWGYNFYGQLGDGTHSNRVIPTEITSKFHLNFEETITQVASGFHHSLAMTSEGRVFTWGRNDDGQLGDGTNTNRNTPIDITSNFVLNNDIGETIIQVSLGGSHSSAITSEGRVFTWGRNNYGQLGDGSTANSNYPIEITSNFVLNNDIGETITQVSLGGYYSSAITSEGRAFTWGVNQSGQLGNGTSTLFNANPIPIEITSQFNLNFEEKITQFSLGYEHSSAITSEGRVFTWGENKYGQLGDGTTVNKLIPTDITSQFNLDDGETITRVSLGGSHSSAITSKAREFTWGDNNSGEVGDGTKTHRNEPVEITSQFNLNDELGETITQFSLGVSHSSAITSEGSIFTWGENTYVQLGDGTNTLRKSPTYLSTFDEEDNEVPVITITGDEIIYIEYQGIYIEQGATCTDNEDGTCSVVVGGDTVDEDTIGTYNITYNASDIAGNEATEVTRTVEVVNVYDITYHLDSGLNGSNPTTYTIVTETITLADASKTGYTFNGWYSEAEFTNKVTEIALGSTEDVALYAKFTATSYGITYHLDSGTNGANQANYTIETATITLADASKTGYTFDGWYSEAEFTNKVTEIALGSTEDVTLYAKFTATSYDITYHLDSGTNGGNPTTYTILTATITLADASRTGYTFDGWYSEAEFTNEVTEIALGSTENVTLYAKFIATSYGITYHLDSGTNGANQANYTIETATITLADASKTGYTFDGWYSEAEFTNKVTEIALGSTEDVTLYAKFTATSYDITYHLDSGTNGGNPTTYTILTATITLADASKTGYRFNGWYSEAEFTNEVTEIALGSTEDVTLYAKFTANEQTITFDTDGGTAVADIVQDYDSALTAPTDPTKVGYTFDGWDVSIPSTMPLSKEFTATYTINNYAVEYIDHDGTVLQTADYDYNADLSGVTAPNDPTRVGYTFNGWSGTVPAIMGTTKIIVKATWIKTETVSEGSIANEVDGLVDAIDEATIESEDVKVSIDIESILEADISEEESILIDGAIDANIEGNTERFTIDISLYYTIEGEDSVYVSNASDLLTITINIPEEDRGYSEYYVIRIHEGVSELLETVFDEENQTLTFQTDKFSTYSIIYETGGSAWGYLFLLLLIPIGYFGYQYKDEVVKFTNHMVKKIKLKKQ